MPPHRTAAQMITQEIAGLKHYVEVCGYARLVETADAIWPILGGRQ